MIASPVAPLPAPARLLQVRAGHVAPLGSHPVASGFVKQPLTHPAAVTVAGLADDEQADHRVHGPPEKAVYAYPAAAYAVWQAAVPDHADRLVHGALGENLVVDGWSDGDVAIGDRVRIGTALLQVTEPRTPCFKLGLAFGDNTMPRHFARVGISGWYYRVLEPGTIAAGDVLTCVGRPNPEWTVARFYAAITTGSIDDATLASIAALDGVSQRWRAKALMLLARRGAG